jgi:hypothetical protein
MRHLASHLHGPARASAVDAHCCYQPFEGKRQQLFCTEHEREAHYGECTQYHIGPHLLVRSL